MCEWYSCSRAFSGLWKGDLGTTTGNVNWFSQDESASFSNFLGLFRSLKYIYYFFPLPASCYPKCKWGCVKCLVLPAHVKTCQHLSLFTTSQKSSHVRWTCSGHKKIIFLKFVVCHWQIKSILTDISKLSHSLVEQLLGMWMFKFLVTFFCGCLAISLLFAAVNYAVTLTKGHTTGQVLRKKRGALCIGMMQPPSSCCSQSQCHAGPQYL